MATLEDFVPIIFIQLWNRIGSNFDPLPVDFVGMTELKH